MDVPALRAALLAAEFTHDAVVSRVGPRAHAALGRNETTPALRRTATGSPLDTLVRLFLLQAPVERAAADRALPGLVDELAGEGFLEAAGGEVRALLDCRPYADDDRDLWVISDLTPGLDGAPNAVAADHVLGVSPASISLAQLTLRAPVGSALDLGTGCGVQALHLTGHADRVVATDVNRRALRLAALTCALNEVEVDLREGSLWDPVAGEQFDLVTTNPPFVVSPPGADVLVYRDSGLPGDEVVERIVREAAAHLTPGGWCQVLANWVVLRDVPWDERLARWVDDGRTALVVQREVLDPAEYVELWLRDAGHHGAPGYADRYDRWLGWLDDQGVEGIGFGWLNLRNAPGPHTFLDHPYAVEQPVAPAIAAWGAAVDLLGHLDDDALLVARPLRADDVRQETEGPPGAEDPATIVLRRQRGLRRARSADTVTAALVGAADGDLTTGQLLDAISMLLDRDAAELQAAYLPAVRELAEHGFLVLGPDPQRTVPVASSD